LPRDFQTWITIPKAIQLHSFNSPWMFTFKFSLHSLSKHPSSNNSEHGKY
jgi:hypothetical protein